MIHPCYGPTSLPKISPWASQAAVSSYSIRSSFFIPDRKRHFDLYLCSLKIFRQILWLYLLCGWMICVLSGACSLTKKKAPQKQRYRHYCWILNSRAVLLVYVMYMIMLNCDWSCEADYTCVPFWTAKQAQLWCLFFILFTHTHWGLICSRFLIFYPVSYLLLPTVQLHSDILLKCFLCYIHMKTLLTNPIHVLLIPISLRILSISMMYPSSFLKDFLNNIFFGWWPRSKYSRTRSEAALGCLMPSFIFSLWKLNLQDLITH